MSDLTCNVPTCTNPVRYVWGVDTDADGEYVFDPHGQLVLCQHHADTARQTA